MEAVGVPEFCKRQPFHHEHAARDAPGHRHGCIAFPQKPRDEQPDDTAEHSVRGRQDARLQHLENAVCRPGDGVDTARQRQHDDERRRGGGFTWEQQKDRPRE